MKLHFYILGNNAANLTNHEQTILTGAGDTIRVENSEAYGMFTHEATTTTDEDLYTNPAYTPEKPVTTATNESYNYPAKYDPSNAIKAKPNEAYAMSVTTEKNETNKPVINVSGVCDEYDYI